MIGDAIKSAEQNIGPKKETIKENNEKIKWQDFLTQEQLQHYVFCQQKPPHYLEVNLIDHYFSLNISYQKLR